MTLQTSSAEESFPALTQIVRRRESSIWRDAVRRMARNRLAVVSVGFILLLVLSALLAEIVAPYDPFKLNPSLAWGQPSAAHWFGTDNLGRDILSRIIYGTRISLTVGLVVQVIVLGIGVPLGLISGHYGGLVDMAVMRVVEVVLCFPTLLLIIILMSLFERNLFTMFIAIGLAGWAGIARLVRGEVLRLRALPFVEAARAVGGNDWHIMFRHILPNILAPIIVSATLGIPAAIMSEASLSFIGIGLPPPAPSWGTQLMEAFTGIRSSPHAVIFPATIIALTLLAFSYLGDGLRDALDPAAFGRG
jgi:ABC-type dipeptide/oligopeptide/nickel transport system permease subunit